MSKKTLAQWLEHLEQLHPTVMELGLERVDQVANTLGLLPLPMPVVTVAGTNGKGSCVAMLESLLLQCGKSTGSFTSPHLERFNERIRVSGQEASDEDITQALTQIDAARGAISLTYFEFATLAALLVFRQHSPDVVILEVGLGGRLDSTNIVDPDVAVITSIDLDHQQYLGDTRDAIGVEKAGILRRAVPAVIADPRPPAALLQRAQEVGADPLLLVGDPWRTEETDAGWKLELWQGGAVTRVIGQLPVGPLLPANVGAAAQAALLLDVRFTDEQFLAALQAAQPAGRCTEISHAGCQYVLDVAHNPAAVAKLLQFLQRRPVSGRQYALFSAMGDKDIAAMLSACAGVFDAWFLADQPTQQRVAPAADIAASLRAVQLEGEHTDQPTQMAISMSRNLRQALARAQSVMSAGDRLVVFGSFTTVGSVSALLQTQRNRHEAATTP
tara:strand:- start:17801 stop:19132 length:1332 start_codon:yes stop_codon:yes gene_type:complete